MEGLHLPHGFCPLETQVAGHAFKVDHNSIGLLKDRNSGYVLKPLGKPSCGLREFGFYQALQTTNDPIFLKIRQFVPVFKEKVEITVNGRNQEFLKMENITRHMKEPCIIDIKIGKRTWDPLATPEKKAAEEQKYAASKQTLGLCVPGLQVYSVDTNEFLRFGKDYGKRLNEKTLFETIILYLNAQRKCYPPLIQSILRQLYNIQNWFKKQTYFQFYSSSILIAYDCQRLKTIIAQCERLSKRSIKKAKRDACFQGRVHEMNVNTNSDTNLHESWIQVKMIDFAHVFPIEDQSVDTNYLFGLQNLIAIFEKLLTISV